MTVAVPTMPVYVLATASYVEWNVHRNVQAPFWLNVFETGGSPGLANVSVSRSPPCGAGLPPGLRT